MDRRNGKQFGIGRPYLGKDPPHLAPIDGKEYASRRGPKAQHAQSQVKKPVPAGCAGRSQREADQYGSAALKRTCELWLRPADEPTQTLSAIPQVGKST